MQASLPLAVTVLLTEQASAGAVKLAVKLADAPGARLGTVNTVLGTDWSLTTVTLFKVTLPEFLNGPGVGDQTAGGGGRGRTSQRDRDGRSGGDRAGG